MPASGTFVIVGGGLADAKAAEALRQQGFGGRIMMTTRTGMPVALAAADQRFLAGLASQPRTDSIRCSAAAGSGQ